MKTQFVAIVSIVYILDFVCFDVATTIEYAIRQLINLWLGVYN